MPKKCLLGGCLFMAWLLVCLLTAPAALAQDDAEQQDTTVSQWTREQAGEIERTPETTIPPVERGFRDISEGLWTWDTWVLRNRDGSIARVGDFLVIFSLWVPDDTLPRPDDRHAFANIRYYYSRDGVEWTDGGELFPAGTALGARQWSGSAVVEGETIHFFYTATGDPGEEAVSFEQRMAMASGRVTADDEGVSIGDWGGHRIILEPDGFHYQTFEAGQAAGVGVAFRDPFFYQDPDTGQAYLLFAGSRGEYPVGEAQTACEQPQLFSGNVGIAVAENPDDLAGTNWRLEAPLIDATCVNTQMELPHILDKDGQTYLFVSTTSFTFAPDLQDKPTGLYGFVADGLRGEYRPLNEGGLVAANPEDEPLQTYAWIVLPDETAISFINYFDISDFELGAFISSPPEVLRDHFGGTLAPTLRLEIEGETARIAETLEPGVIPGGSGEDGAEDGSMSQGSTNLLLLPGQ